jgi:hypothetical protein
MANSTEIDQMPSLCCHALSGDAHAEVCIRGRITPGGGDDMIGPDKQFDTENILLSAQMWLAMQGFNRACFSITL